MADPGRIPSPAAHRFVPTLTEVVLPEAMAASVVPAESTVTTAPSVSPEVVEQIVDAAIRRADVVLTQKLPELLAVVLHEHALAVSERLRREIKASVREAVLAEMAAAPRARGLPAGASGSSGPTPSSGPEQP